MTPPYIFFCGLKQEQQPHVLGLRLLATHARSISLIWKMKEKKSFYSCSLFVIFIHSLAKDVCSRHPFVIEYGYISLVISSPTLPLEIAPIWWSMSTIWWSLSLFETLTIWDHQCRHEGTADQMSPVTALSRIGQFQNRKQSHDNVDVVGNDDGFWSQ